VELFPLYGKFTPTLSLRRIQPRRSLEVEKKVVSKDLWGRTEVLPQGLTEGRAEMREEILGWLQRKEEAEREGRDFYESMPGTEVNDRGNRNGNSAR
jgi:hypothetical protein